MDREGGVCIVESHDKAKGYLIPSHRVYKAPAKLVVFLPPTEGPAHRVYDTVEGLWNLPYLLYAQGMNLRIRSLYLKVLDQCLHQMPLCSLSKDCDLCRNIRAGLKAPHRVAVPIQSLVARSDALYNAALHYELHAGSLI